MEEKIPKINEPNYVNYEPSSRKRNPNVFVQFNFKGENYHRFRNKHESLYPTGIFYNSLLKEFGVDPSPGANPNWDKKEGEYELLSAGIYEVGKDGRVYLSKNGSCLPGPTREVSEDVSKESDLELILKDRTNSED